MMTQIMSSKKDVEETFEELKKDGKNTVDNLVKWMRDAQVLTEKTTDAQVKNLFKGLEASKVELEKFKEVLTSLAAEQKQSLENLTRKLSAESVTFLDAIAKAVKAGAKAFKDATK